VRGGVREFVRRKGVAHPHALRIDRGGPAPLPAGDDGR